MHREAELECQGLSHSIGDLARHRLTNQTLSHFIETALCARKTGIHVSGTNQILRLTEPKEILSPQSFTEEEVVLQEGKAAFQVQESVIWSDSRLASQLPSLKLP